MLLTTEYMQRYVGGQHEIQHPDDGCHYRNQGYHYRNQIKSIKVEDDPGQAGLSGQAAILVIEYEYCCEFKAGEGFKPSENKQYNLSLGIAGVSDIGGGRLCINSPIVGEMSVFYPPTHHKRVLADGTIQVDD